MVGSQWEADHVGRLSRLGKGLHFNLNEVGFSREVILSHITFFNMSFWQEIKEDMTSKYKQQIGKIDRRAVKS